MKYNGIYWTFFSPMIKSSIRKRYGKDLACEAVTLNCADVRRAAGDEEKSADGAILYKRPYYDDFFI